MGGRMRKKSSRTSRWKGENLCRVGGASLDGGMAERIQLDASTMPSANPLDRFVPESVRAHIEQNYYAHVNAQAHIEQFLNAPQFWASPGQHPALFSDHGVVHVRDVAQRILRVLDLINGVLIPRRTSDEMEGFMYGYGVMLAYLHDIGMADLSAFGRAMHPEFAAQAVFTDALDAVLNTLWNENSGNVARRLTDLSDKGILTHAPQIVFRELLSLSIGHSKSKLPVQVLDDPAALRAQMQDIVSHSLPELYNRQQAAKGKPVEMTKGVEELPQFLPQYGAEFVPTAFDWLVDEADEARRLVGEVTDTLRALRCADAMRQRGTVQKTSGGYQVFVSQQTGNAVFALDLGDGRMYLLELQNQPLSVGEANIATCELTAEGDLRVGFHRGAYTSDDALHRSAHYTAITINDFLKDIVESFWRGAAPEGGALKTSREIQILLESTDDNPRFVELVQAHLRQISEYGDQIQIVPSLQNIAQGERDLYLAGQALDWDPIVRQAALDQIARSGQRTRGVDPTEGFRHVKYVRIQAGQTLLQAGSPAAFVYVPLGGGLKIIRPGGYDPLPVAPWALLGTTGVIRGAVRNADVVALQDTFLLMIPKSVYLQYWYAPYTPEELRPLLPPTF